MSKRIRKSNKTARRHTSPPPIPSSNSGLTGERLNRLKDRVAKFNANIAAIKASVEKDRDA